MRWSVLFGGVGVTLATLAGSAAAQYAPTLPYGGGYYYNPYAGLPPGCATPMVPYSPAMPGVMAPGYGSPMPAMPGTMAPSAGSPGTGVPNRLPSTTPGTTTPGTTTPGTTTPGTTTPPSSTNTTTPSTNVPSGQFGDGASATDSRSFGAEAAAAASASESRGEAGSGSLASAAPNMMGDVFGGGVTRVSVSVPIATRLGGTFIDSGTGQPALFGFNRNQSLPTFTAPPGSNVTVFGTPITEPFRASGPLTQLGGNQVYPLAENSQDRAATLNFAQITLGPDGQLIYVSDPNVSRATPVGTPNASGQQNANIATFYDYVQLEQLASNVGVPTPSSGGLVGRTKISEDNNPIPRDRIIFNYDYFGGVDFGPKGQGVNRFSPGFEMTFFDSWTSIEVRLPFASTINSNIITDGATADGVLLGNANVTFKALAYRSENLFVAGGLAIAAPTGSDVGLRTQSGTQLLRMVNESVVLTPYAAVLLLPCEDVFVMGYYSVAFDTMGSPVEVNFGGDRLRNVGRIYDAPFQMIDVQLGAWLYRNNDEYSVIRGVAGFVEGHYNMNLGSGTSLSGLTYSVVDPLDFEELNVVAGFTTMLGTNSTFTVGAAFPVLGGDNKSFDFQIGVRANVFFGPTARNRSVALRASSF